jgi:hypothetical protein
LTKGASDFLFDSHLSPAIVGLWPHKPHSKTTIIQPSLAERVDLIFRIQIQESPLVERAFSAYEWPFCGTVRHTPYCDLLQERAMHDWNDDYQPPWTETGDQLTEVIVVTDQARLMRYLIHFATDEEREAFQKSRTRPRS